MDAISLQEMVDRENEAFRIGLTASALMEAAGEAMAARIQVIYPAVRQFVVLAGKGNNGGDGLVVARYLAGRGKNVRVVLALPEDQLGELPKTMLERLRQAAPDVEIIPWHNNFTFPGSDAVIVDALLGLQTKGVLRGIMAGIVAQLNNARARNFFRTVALDFPSGLAAYESAHAPQSRDAATASDVTMAVGFAKEVLCREALAPWVGRLEVIPWSTTTLPSGPLQTLDGHELSGVLPRRSALSHKGDFGRLAIVAGSPGFTGAATLCAQAAQALGTGLLSIVTHAEAHPIVAAQAPPEAMVSAWPKGDALPDILENASAIVIGPGLGTGPETVKMLRAALDIGCPVLVDADGLNVLAKNPDLLNKAKGSVILTPHPGEMARLLGRKFEAAEREAAARAFIERHDVTLILKGTRTLIASRGNPLFVNTTGNPGLSTGGSGDTLSGLLGALLAQGLSPVNAARLGVWLHGHAADLALIKRGCEEGLTPTMLSENLGAALVSLRGLAAAGPGLLGRAKTLL